MEFSCGFEGMADEIVSLFSRTFTASEGSDEGELVGTLAKRLLETTRDEDLFVFLARQEAKLVGCIIFSRLSFERDERIVFLLSPVAVEASRQGEGIGQALLSFGLNALRERGVDAVATYGNPDYYAKVGFAPVGEATLPAPFPLSRPEGWLARSLTDRSLAPVKGSPRCVEAFDDPAYW